MTKTKKQTQRETCVCGYQGNGLGHHMHSRGHYPTCSCGSKHESFQALRAHWAAKGHVGCSANTNIAFICACGKSAKDWKSLTAHMAPADHRTYYRNDKPNAIELGPWYNFDTVMASENKRKDHEVGACFCGHGGLELGVHMHNNNHYPTCSCGAFFNTFDLLGYHQLKEGHMGHSAHVKKRFLCSCGKMYNKYKELCKHLLQADHRRYYEKDKPDAITFGPDTVQCSLCPVLCHSKEELAEHAVYEHPLCRKCNSLFRKVKFYTDHLKTGTCKPLQHNRDAPMRQLLGDRSIDDIPEGHPLKTKTPELNRAGFKRQKRANSPPRPFADESDDNEIRIKDDNSHAGDNQFPDVADGDEDGDEATFRGIYYRQDYGGFGPAGHDELFESYEDYEAQLRAFYQAQEFLIGLSMPHQASAA